MENRKARPRRRILTSLPKQVLAVITGAFLIGAYPCAMQASAATIAALIAGALMSTANVLLGYAAIEYSAGRSYTTFIKFVLGGMGIRMAAMLVTFFLGIRVFELPVVPFSVSMFTFYVVYLILEILYIQSRVHTLHTVRENAHSTR